MKVKTINYQKVFPLAQYVNERIGVEIELSIHDNEDEAFAKAKELVHAWADEKSQLHDSGEPYPYSGIEMPHTQIQNPTTIPPLPEEKVSLEDEIKNSQDLHNLESCNFLIKAEKDPERKRKLLLLYDERKEQLSPKAQKKSK